MVYELYCLRHDLIEEVHDREFELFHAVYDPAPVKDRVYELLAQHNHYRVDSVTFPKNVIHPPLRPLHEFYPHVAHYLLRWIFQEREGEEWDRVIVIMASFKLRSSKEAFLKAVKTNIKPYLTSGQRYEVWFHTSSAHPLLQVADYFGWAIHRRRERADSSYYKKIRRRVSSDFSYYSRVTKTYY